MNRFTKYVWVALAVLAVGCSKSDGGDGSSVPGGEPGTGVSVPEGMVSVSLGLSAEGSLRVASAPGSKADTRSASPDETAVGDMWMLQFDTEASAEGSLMHRAFIPAQDIKQSGTSLTASVMLRESAGSVIVVVANSPESFTASVLPDGTKLTEFRARTFAVSATAGTSLPSDASSYLPMYGETAPMAVSVIGSQSVSLELTRLVSRLSFTLNNYLTSGYPSLELTEVTLHNAPVKIAYGPLTESATHLGEVFPESEESNFRNYESVKTNLTGVETSYRWYVAPNRRGKGTAAEPGDKSALTAPEGQGSYCTYISIRGKLTLTEGAAEKEVTYNVYVGTNDTDDYNLWANAAYSARLMITGYNGDRLEVGYDGFGITVGALDGLADNTITGWHPDTGLDYVPGFLSFAPYRIDFGDTESPDAQKVTFRINSSWRFSYTSGDADKVIASSSVGANTDQAGGAHDEPTECEVTFTPVAYRPQIGTPVAGTQYNTVATFSTVGGTVTDTRTTLLLRTVPTFYGDASVSPEPGGGALPVEGASVRVTMPSNARWSVSASHGTTNTQEADSYASRTCEVQVAANNTWQDRQVKVVLQYGENSKEWVYTQPGMSISGVTISPDPGVGIPEEGASYTITVSGRFERVPIRVRQSDGTVLDLKAVVSTGSGTGGSGQLHVPANSTPLDRTLVFEYQENGRWKAVGRGLQKGSRIWLQPIDPNAKGSWSDARNYCRSQGYWRLPTQNELMYCYVIDPGLDSRFNKGMYWTSSHIHGHSAYADHIWVTYFANGTTSDLTLASASAYVRCVGMFAVEDYPKVVTTSDGGIAIVTRENGQGLPQEAVRTEHWSSTVVAPPESDLNRVASTFQVQKEASGATYNWNAAKDYCDNLVAEGHDDWRLPTQREIMVMWFMGGNELVHNGEKNDAGVGAPSYRVGNGYLYEQPGFAPFGRARHWSSTRWDNAVYSCWYGVYYDGSASPGVIAADQANYNSMVRCVRDVR